ncbi:DUF4942 domain-containing protein [Ralstonia thomasii]|uniref:DUF4942 domain-containing protein n=1 Tax=Ralstonia thomasii TaxID=3058596 RepID=UPI003C2DF458
MTAHQDFTLIDNADVQEASVLDDGAEFFAPVQSDVLDSLLGRYQTARAKIEQLAEFANGPEHRDVFRYFVDGNCQAGHRLSGYNTVESLFDAAGAIAALNARCWTEALNLTDVLDCMPAKRRDEWTKQIQEMKTPDFVEDTVRPTILRMLSSRQQFLAERVDGVFHALSDQHVTNAPEGFNRRMIINWMLSYGYVNHPRASFIHDLRCVVAKFMGRTAPSWRLTYDLLDSLRSNTGVWVNIDGGAMRVRLYKKGTAHVEVHPDMAWRLNQILAHMHPQAIPSAFRTKPVRAPKAYTVMRKPLPFETLDLLCQGRSQDNDYWFTLNASDDNSFKHACGVLASIGGVPHPKDRSRYQFDYPIGPVIRELVRSGCMPDQKSHQFYATPAAMAEEVADMAEIGDEDSVLEPSAGQGALATHLPIERTTCVEISQLHCEILRARGYTTHHADFIDWAATTHMRFSRIVMNPPFSDGRALVHLRAAATLLKPEGRLVAILPGSMRGKNVLPGWHLSWSGIRTGEFADTGASVVILTATPGAA